MRFTLFILLTLLSWNSLSQDPQFSQYYAAPLYLNPAFTGTSQSHRFIANYRNQWPNIARGFVTTAVSYDVDLHQYNSGIGSGRNGRDEVITIEFSIFLQMEGLQ